MDIEDVEARESLAYIAGILDGEGCVGIYTNNNRGCSVQVRIDNTYEGLIYYINLHLPGHTHTREGYNSRCKEVYDVCWFGRDAIDVLELLLPYLIVKKEVAETVIEFYYNCMSKGGRALTESQIILRESYRDKVRSLNGG